MTDVRSNRPRRDARCRYIHPTNAGKALGPHLRRDILPATKLQAEVRDTQGGAFIGPYTAAVTDATAVPVNVYENDREVMVAAPMPGVAPEDIDVEVTDDRHLLLRARQHGPGQERIEYLVREWSYGPFERAIELPRNVDAPRANLSLGNGVLMISLPKSDSHVAGRLEVERRAHARGMTAGHSGRDDNGGQGGETHQQVRRGAS